METMSHSKSPANMCALKNICFSTSHKFLFYAILFVCRQKEHGVHGQEWRALSSDGKYVLLFILFFTRCDLNTNGLRITG